MNSAKLQFWVVDNKTSKVKLIEGELKEEDESSWCAGDFKFHALDGAEYISWYNSEEEAITDRLNHNKFMLKSELELCEEICRTDKLYHQKQYGKKIAYWEEVLKDYNTSQKQNK